MSSALSASPDAAPVQALLFDLDGTLYPKLRLRATMMAELALLPLRGGGFRDAWRQWQCIRGFRREREGLRELGDGCSDLARRQYELAARRLGVDPGHLAALVDTWIHQRPLRHLASVRRPGLPALLARLRARGLKLGVFSDYPAEAKLAAMGILEHFDLVLDAEDEEVSALKPHPKGLLRAAQVWACVPTAVTYVGDRPEVDAPAAARAGMPCLLIGAGLPPAGASWQAIRSLLEIEQRLDQGPWPERPRAGS